MLQFFGQKRKTINLHLAIAQLSSLPCWIFVSKKIISYMLSRLWIFFKKPKRLSLIPLRLCKGSGFFKNDETQKYFYFHLESARLKILQIWSPTSCRWHSGSAAVRSRKTRQFKFARSLSRSRRFGAVRGRLMPKARFVIAFLNPIFS